MDTGNCKIREDLFDQPKCRSDLIPTPNDYYRKKKPITATQAERIKEATKGLRDVH